MTDVRSYMELQSEQTHKKHLDCRWKKDTKAGTAAKWIVYARQHDDVAVCIIPDL